MTAAADLPDPRCYNAARSENALLRLAAEACRGDRAAKDRLLAHLRRHLVANDDAALQEALARAPSAAVYRLVWDAICAVAESCDADGADATIVARPFAIPVIVVAGARRVLEIPGALPDVSEIQALLGRHGALGATRNFGVSAELCPLEALERLTPSSVFHWNHAYSSVAPTGMPGSPIEVAAGSEQVHLRFILGAGITPAHLPSFLETAANIGKWGAAFTRTVARQLAQAGLDLLPLARPPAGLLRAQGSGRDAVIETAFHLFASHALRTCRMTAGEPVVVLSAHREAGAEVRVSVSSALDDALLEGFCWPLHPADDLEVILSSIAGLLKASRVTDLRVAPEVVSGLDASGAPRFLSARAFDRASWLQPAHQPMS